MVSGSAACGAAASCGAPPEASSPTRKPESQARCVALAEPTTWLRRSMSSSANGAVFGIGMRCIGAPVYEKENEADAVMEGFSMWIQCWRKKKKFLLTVTRKANDF